MAYPSPERSSRSRPAGDERSLGELVKDLAEETRTLFRQETDLARAELSEKVGQARDGAVSFAVAAVAGLGAFAALTACLILALSYAIAPVFAALVVAFAYGVIAGAAALRGRGQVRSATPMVPQQTVETLKEDVRWLKTRG